MKYVKTFEEFLNESFINEINIESRIESNFNKPHYLRSIRNKEPFDLEIRSEGSIEKIKKINKNADIEVIKAVNPRVKQPITFHVIIKKWDLDSLKKTLSLFFHDTVSSGFTSNQQIDAYIEMYG
tara:strand:- start:935 stop:1309 length:375 start_codon:yes stop_codon:yes gene_type:complete